MVLISNFYRRTSQLYGAKNSGENLNDKKCQWTRPTIRAQGTRTKRPIRTHHAYYSHETRPYSCFHLGSWYRRFLAVRLYWKMMYLCFDPRTHRQTAEGAPSDASKETCIDVS